jgi:hypothetical protein
MKRPTVFCLAEGYSEENLVNRLLAPHLSALGVDIHATKVTTGRDRRAGKVYKGGGSTIQHYLNDFEGLYKQWEKEKNVYFTLLMDVYGLPADFPRRAEGLDIKDPRKKVQFMEDQLAQAVQERSIPAERFIPHLTLHEFETFLFANLDEMRIIFPDKNLQISKIKEDVLDFGGDIEAINHTPEGSPSKRIAKRISIYENYKAREQSGAINVLENIGLPHLRHACPHFGAWLSRLEALALTTSITPPATTSTHANKQSNSPHQ